MDHVPGTVYLLHLNQPYKHAKHYLGWAANLDARLAQHADGSGARLLQVVKGAGINCQFARTCPGGRFRERQLKKQGGRSRMCQVCKHARQDAKEVLMKPAAPDGHTQTTSPAHDVIRAELPADLTSARQARATVRQALAAWGMDDPSGDVELLASELVANATEHAIGPICLALSRQAAPNGQAGISCEVTDTSPAQPRLRQVGTCEERGRGLAIVTALASASGVRTEPDGKTSWFTLALRDRAARLNRQAEAEAEAEAGA